MPAVLRRYHARVIWALAITTTMLMSTGNADDMNPLVAERWQHRPLVLVAPASSNPALRDAIARVRDAEHAFADRDMVLYVVTAEEATRAGETLAPEQRRALIAALDVTPRATTSMILVGKDGGVKRRAPLETSLEQVFQQIDGMPMRQREMREND